MNARIRFATFDDAAEIQAIYAPFCEASTVSFETAAPSIDQIADRMTDGGDQHAWIVCECNDAVAGYAYASPHGTRAAFAWAVNVAIYVHPDFRGKSIGRALYGSLLLILRAQGFVKALAAITGSNDASMEMHQRCGFRESGRLEAVGFKRGQWLSVCWYEYLLQPLPTEPALLSSISELAASQIAAAFAAGESILCTRHGRG